MIYYFMPYSPKGLGYAYNAHCALVPNANDWICLTDIDVMFFSSQRMGQQLEAIIEAHHPPFSAFTCVTNRSSRGCRQQQLDRIRDERDLLKLKERADFQTTHCAGQVKELHSPLSGHFLLFPRRLWDEFPFAEVGASKAAPGHNILGIDSDWEERLKKAGHKIGLIYSLMAAHYYRMDDAEELVGHLPGGLEWFSHMPSQRSKAGPPWKFVKRFGVHDLLTFPDGSQFRFPRVRLEDGSGFASSSELVTSDKALADNLRAAMADPVLGIVDVPV